MTPPLGYSLFALKSVTPTIPIQHIVQAACPFVIIYLIAIGLFVMFPSSVTFLPNAL